MDTRHESTAAQGGPDRRAFLGRAGLAGAAALAGAAPVEPSDTGPDRIPTKPFGKTGERVSIIGLGGHALGLAPTYEEAERLVHEAIDAGVDFFDNAWEYHEGK